MDFAIYFLARGGEHLGERGGFFIVQRHAGALLSKSGLPEHSSAVQSGAPLDRTAHRPLPVSPLSLLRSSLFIAIVSLFVVTGYGFDLFGECCGHREVTQTEQGGTAPAQKTPANGDGCQCICHQVIAPLATEPVRVASATVVASKFVAAPDKFPPDAVPLGIDYPPQIA